METEHNPVQEFVVELMGTGLNVDVPEGRDDCDLFVEGFKFVVLDDNELPAEGKIGFEILQTEHRDGGKSTYSGLTKAALYEAHYNAGIVIAHKFRGEDNIPLWMMYRPSQALNFLNANKKNTSAETVIVEGSSNTVFVTFPSDTIDTIFTSPLVLEGVTDLSWRHLELAELFELPSAKADVRKINALIGRYVSSVGDISLPEKFNHS